MFVDSTFCIDLIRERSRHESGPATLKLRALGETPLRLPVFVLCELRLGAGLSSQPERELARCDTLAACMDIVYPDARFAGSYVQCELALRKLGKPAPTMDVLIAAIAVRHAEALITRGRKHLHHVPGLVLEVY